MTLKVIQGYEKNGGIRSFRIPLHKFLVVSSRLSSSFDGVAMFRTSGFVD